MIYTFLGQGFELTLRFEFEREISGLQAIFSLHDKIIEIRSQQQIEFLLFFSN